MRTLPCVVLGSNPLSPSAFRPPSADARTDPLAWRRCLLHPLFSLSLRPAPPPPPPPPLQLSSGDRVLHMREHPAAHRFRTVWGPDRSIRLVQEALREIEEQVRRVRQEHGRCADFPGAAVQSMRSNARLNPLPSFRPVKSTQRGWGGFPITPSREARSPASFTARSVAQPAVRAHDSPLIVITLATPIIIKKKVNWSC